MTTREVYITLPDALLITPWTTADDTIDPRSGYAERFWLPIIGPSAMFLLRQISSALEVQPEGYTMNVDEAGQWLGINAGAVMLRTVNRLIGFGMARIENGTLAVRTHLSPLSATQLGRLPAGAVAEQERFLRHQEALRG